MYWDPVDQRAGVVTLPGIYRFTVDNRWIYVGRFTHASRPLKEYVRNLTKLIEGRAYRPKKPEGFRTVHRALFWAFSEGRTIKVEIVENVESERLNERERFWISQVSPEWRLNGRKTFP